MANISLMGATFYDVPAVELPTAGGGTSTFYEVSGSQTITQNGTYDVTALAQAIVSVAGGGGLEYESGTYEPSSDVVQPTISFSKTHTTVPIFIMLSDVTDTTLSANSNMWWAFTCWYIAFGEGVIYSGSSKRYARVQYEYKTSSSSTSSGSPINSMTNSSTVNDLLYWLSTSSFKPSSNSTSRYWRANRTYKWIAVWAPEVSA